MRLAGTVADVSYNWVWLGEARNDFLALSERDRAALSERIAYLSQNPWPDWFSKEFVYDLPVDVLVSLARAGSIVETGP